MASQTSDLSRGNHSLVIPVSAALLPRFRGDTRTSDADRLPLPFVETGGADCSFGSPGDCRGLIIHDLSNGGRSAVSWARRRCMWVGGWAGPSEIESAQTPTSEPELELDARPESDPTAVAPTPTAPPDLATPDHPLDLGKAGTIPVLDPSTLLVDAATVVFDTFDGGSMTLAEAEPNTIVGLIDAIPPIDAPDYRFGPQASWLNREDVVIGYVDPTS